MFTIFKEEKVITAGILVFLCLSVLVRLMLAWMYHTMIRETDNMATTGNRLLKQCKVKFANCYQLNGGVSNIPVFVDKFLNRLSFGHLSFDAWYHLSGQCMLFSVIFAGVGICKGILDGRMLGEILPFYIASFLGLYLYFSLSALVDIKGKRRVLKTNLIDYLSVSAGEPLVQVNGENTENTIFDLEQSLQKAQKELEEAEKNAAYANAVAPIDGMVIGLSITPGQEITASATALTISDTNTVTISATVDERNVSYLKVGMGVDLNQWGNPSFGTISSVSLSSSVNNGVATYPFTIEADNADGTLQINSNINYNLTASQSDNCLVLPIQAVRTVGLEDGTSATVVYLKADSMPDNAIELPYSDETIPEGFYPVQVEIGIQDNNNVEIKSGVEQGAEVFTQYMTGSATSWDNYGMVY